MHGIKIMNYMYRSQIRSKLNEVAHFFESVTILRLLVFYVACNDISVICDGTGVQAD